jgi:hypothetical protein
MSAPRKGEAEARGIIGAVQAGIVDRAQVLLARRRGNEDEKEVEN